MQKESDQQTERIRLYVCLALFVYPRITAKQMWRESVNKCRLHLVFQALSFVHCVAFSTEVTNC